MQDQQTGRRIPVSAIAGIAAAVLAIGGGAWWAINSINPPNQPSVPVKTQNSPQLGTEKTAQIYWLKDAGNKMELVARPVTRASGDQPNQVLEAAFSRLLAGPPSDGNVSSTIPEGTKLRGVKIDKDDIHVNLSQEFTSGGGSAAMSGRVAQIIYTATSLQPNAKVYIDVEGKRLDVLGGEGLELEQPLTRKSFEENFSL